MKWISICLAIVCASRAFGDDPAKIEHPTKRMIAISQKYNIEPMYTIHDADRKLDLWVFLGRSAKHMFHALPVVVPANATNHDVEISIMSADNCAAFYDILIQKQKDSTPDQRFQPGI
jgi:hypothetical protein